MKFILPILFLFLLPLLVYGQGNTTQTSDTEVSFPLYANGFSQKDSLSVVSEKEVKKFHKMIFDIAVDTILDSSATYKLLYVSSKGWSQGFNHSNPKKKYYSNSSQAYHNKLLLISDILKFSVLPKDSIKKLSPFDSLFLEENSVKVSNDSIASFISLNYIIKSRQDYYFKKLKNKKFNNEGPIRVVISFGYEYLLVVTKMTDIGEWSSSSGGAYHYYQKVE